MNDQHPLSGGNRIRLMIQPQMYLMIEQSWIFKPVDEDSILTIAAEFQLPQSIARIMAIRGITDRDISRTFFYPHRETVHDPFLMLDMDKAVARIQNQIDAAGTIVVFGDYDVDGTSGTSLLYLFFKSIDVEVHYYIPDRENEGYGVSKQGIDYAKLIGADLLITCDCGINAFEQIDYANSLKIDVIITDHHKQNKTLPAAHAILNPNRKECEYPFKGLCGAGVAFKLAIAICNQNNLDAELAWEHSDLVAIATATDLVPIKDENRVIVKEGIKRIGEGIKPGILALLKTSELWGKEVTVGRLVFWFSPKINAAGRLGDAARAVKLLTTQNPVYAMEVARELEQVNEQRKDLTQRMVDEAILMVNANEQMEDKAIVLANQGWHHGVIGIVASRIKEEFYKPTVIIALDGNEGKGSCRSIPKFDMVDALDECSTHLGGYGGHPIAAGLSIKGNEVDKFKNAFLAVANKNIDTHALEPQLKIDGEMKISEINSRFLKFLRALEPYGPGNMRPIFVTRNVNIAGLPKIIGKNHDTLKFTVKEHKTSVEAIGFNMVDHYDKLIRNEPVDIAYCIGENEWNGQKTLQLELKDIKIGGANA